MIKALAARLKQKHRTVEFPRGAPPVLPPLFKGLHALRPEKCSGCGKCAAVCPTGAVKTPLAIHLGECVFCGECAAACGTGALSMTNNYRLAANSKSGLLLKPGAVPAVKPLDAARLNLFARSLKLRQVSAGGCNACEADVNVLNTVVFDLGRFGVQFAASPRHADGLLITGPVTENMEYALRETYAATPEPKIVIAAGACAVSGGLFKGRKEARGIPADIPVDLYIHGCPPHPLTILDGLLRLLGRIK